METDHALVSSGIEPKIHLMRGRRVMLDRDLAALYQVSTKAFNQAVNRNRERFPEDFAFILKPQEVAILRSQIVTSSWGGRRYRPYVFTEHGVAMLSAVLRSERAMEMSVAIVRAFIRLREVLATNRELALRMDKMEAEQSQLKEGQAKHGSVLNIIVKELQSLRVQPEPSRKKIGFHGGN